MGGSADYGQTTGYEQSSEDLGGSSSSLSTALGGSCGSLISSVPTKGKPGPAGIPIAVTHDVAPQGPSHMAPMAAQFPNAHDNGAHRTKPTTMKSTSAENRARRILQMITRGRRTRFPVPRRSTGRLIKPSLSDGFRLIVDRHDYHAVRCQKPREKPVVMKKFDRVAGGLIRGSLPRLEELLHEFPPGRAIPCARARRVPRADSAITSTSPSVQSAACATTPLRRLIDGCRPLQIRRSGIDARASRDTPMKRGPRAWTTQLRRKNAM